MVVETRKIYTTVAIVALVGLLFSCVAGAVAGGVAGFLVGQRQGRLVAERVVSGSVGAAQQAIPVPTPGVELHPGPFAAPRQAPSDVAGALVVEVVSGTPADQAGLQAGDVIVAIDSTPVNAIHQLPDVIAQYQPGDQVTVHFWRDGRQQAVTVGLGTNPDNSGQAYLGIYFEMQ
jgi:membrane-associated protease RseP (regulator of RpoE activity)